MELTRGRLSAVGTAQSFQPKLVLTVDAVNGIPLDLNLSEDTRRSLVELVRRLQDKAAVAEEVGQDDQLLREENDARSISTESTDRESICRIKFVGNTHYPFFKVETLSHVPKLVTCGISR